MRKLFCTFYLIFIVHNFFTLAQNVGIGTNSPKARLDVESTNSGFLPPRMTFAQRNAMQNPVAGLMIYCTDCSIAGEMQYYNGSEWIAMTFAPAKRPVSINASVVNNGQPFVTLNGTISGDSLASVDTRGFCWSTSTSPTITLSTKTVNGSGQGSYSTTLSDLLPSTTYYMRAYAVNNSGVAYSNQVTFTTGTAIAAYMTYTPGAQWNYSVHDNLTGTDSTYTFTSSARDTSISGRNYHLFTNRNNQSQNTENQYFCRVGNDYYNYGISYFEMKFPGTLNNLEEKYFSASTSTGLSWSEAYSGSSMLAISQFPTTLNYSFSLRYTITETGSNLTVGNRTYNNVVKVKVEVVNLNMFINGLGNLNSTINQNTYFYYAPNFGKIKSEQLLFVQTIIQGNVTQLMNVDKTSILTGSNIQ